MTDKRAETVTDHLDDISCQLSLLTEHFGHAAGFIEDDHEIDGLSAVARWLHYRWCRYLSTST